MTTRAIGLWYDTASGEEAAWVVSHDTLDGDGNALATKTEWVGDDYDDARETAEEEGRKHGWPVIETSQAGERKTILPDPKGAWDAAGDGCKEWLYVVDEEGNNAGNASVRRTEWGWVYVDDQDGYRWLSDEEFGRLDTVEDLVE